MLYELEIAMGKVPAPGQRRSAAAVAGRSAVPQYPGRRHRQHAPHRDLHRQAVLAGQPDRPPRPGRIPLLRNAAGRAHEPGPAIIAAGADRLVLARSRSTGRSRAGAPRCMTASCWSISSGPISSRCSATSSVPATRSIRSGSMRSASSVFRITAPCSTAASSSNCAARSSPGTCSARKASPAPRCASSIPPSSACRSRSQGLNESPPRRHLQRPPRCR